MLFIRREKGSLLPPLRLMGAVSRPLALSQLTNREKMSLRVDMAQSVEGSDVWKE